MARINTTDNLLEELRDDDEFRPGLVNALFPGNISLETIWAGQSALHHTQTAVLQNQSDMIDIMSATLQEIRESRDALSEKIDDVDDALGDMNDAFGMFRGHYASEAVGRNRYRPIRSILRALNIRLPDITAYETNETLKAIVVNNLEKLTKEGIDDDRLADFMKIDQVLHIQNMRDRSQEFYMAIESSFTGRSSDITRVLARASVLSATTEMKVYACVAAVGWAPDIDAGLVVEDAAEYLRGNCAATVYWIPLRESTLSPDSAR